MRMQLLLLPLFVASSLFTLASSECPPIDNIPVAYDDSNFRCARLYQAPGDPDPIQACNTCPEEGFTSFDMVANENQTVPDG